MAKFFLATLGGLIAGGIVRLVFIEVYGNSPLVGTVAGVIAFLILTYGAWIHLDEIASPPMNYKEIMKRLDSMKQTSESKVPTPKSPCGRCGSTAWTFLHPCARCKRSFCGRCIRGEEVPDTTYDGYHVELTCPAGHDI
jgi:hypothetical protein